MSPRDSEHLTQCLYEAAAGETTWPRALDAFDAYLDSVGIVVFSFTRDAPPISSSSLVDALSDYVREGWDRVDERFRAVPKMQSGGIASDLDIFTEAQIKRLPFYQEFILKHELKWWSGFAVKTTGKGYYFSVQRSPKQDAFGLLDHERIHAARPLLVSALTLQQARINARQQGILDILEALSQPAFVISPQGTALRWNARAECMLGKGLKVLNGRLCAELHDGQRALDDLHDQVRRQSHSISTPARPVSVVRQSGRPLILSILGDAPKVGDLFASGGTIVVACDPDLRPRGGEEVLATAFNLTRAEAGLAANIAAGLSLVDYAGHMGLAESTVRTLMKRILAKSETSRQGEFIAMAGRMLASLKQPK